LKIGRADKLPGLIVNEGMREIAETYRLFARSFADKNPLAATPTWNISSTNKVTAAPVRSPPRITHGAISTGSSQVELLRKERPVRRPPMITCTR